MKHTHDGVDLEALELLGESLSASGGLEGATSLPGGDWDYVYLASALMHPTGEEGFDANHLDGFEMGLALCGRLAECMNTRDVSVVELRRAAYIPDEAFFPVPITETPPSMQTAETGAGAGPQGNVAGTRARRHREA